MKLSLVLLLVLACVALFKAEELHEDVEELINDEDSSVSFLYDGSMEDEVMGDVDDPADKAKKRAVLSKKGEKRVCARVFIGCLIKTKARCKLVPVCKVKYFACRCIVKGVRKCKKFLHFVRVMANKGRKHDEEVAGDEKEDPKKNWRRRRARLRLCKAGYRKCRKDKISQAKCKKTFYACLKRKNPKKADESEEDEKAIMAEAEENDQDETEIEADEEEDPKKNWRRRRARLRVCKGGYRKCSKGKTFCGKCFKAFGACVKRQKPKKADESEEDEEAIMADAVENDEDETTETEVEEDEVEDAKKHKGGKRRFSKKMIRCGKRAVRCMLRARLNCRRQGRCIRLVMKCVRRARRRPRAGKQ